jgi:hypothetical protein
MISLEPVLVVKMDIFVISRTDVLKNFNYYHPIVVELSILPIVLNVILLLTLYSPRLLIMMEKEESEMLASQKELHSLLVVKLVLELKMQGNVPLLANGNINVLDAELVTQLIMIILEILLLLVERMQISKKKEFPICVLDLNGMLTNNNSSAVNANSDMVLPKMVLAVFQITISVLMLRSRIVSNMKC